MLLTRGTEIILSNEDKALAELIANLRMNENEKEGVTSRKFHVQRTDLSIHMDGFAAELAFAKLCNLYPDLSTHIRSTKTDVGDVQLKDGRSVDVKYTDRPQGKLITPYWKIANIDLYVLMIGSFPKFTFKGSLTKEKFIHSGNLTDLRRTGRKDTYVATQDQLEDLELIPKTKLEEGLPNQIFFMRRQGNIPKAG